jgi:crotonobetainyl-CoA:carnitine CoA-transferase CaiB-like acyl-CoA transferase
MRSGDLGADAIKVERPGIGFEDIRAVRPAFIHCSIKGFGLDGPCGNRAGNDSKRIEDLKSEVVK